MTSLGIVQMYAKTNVVSCAPHDMLGKFIEKYVISLSKKKRGIGETQFRPSEIGWLL